MGLKYMVTENQELDYPSLNWEAVLVLRELDPESLSKIDKSPENLRESLFSTLICVKFG